MKTEFARQLRRTSTEVEKALWRHLRGNRFVGFKFRRQQPIGPYIADFVCFERKLVIELDGSQHASSTSDAVRDQWFEQRDYAVKRYWNNQVNAQLDAVLEDIYRALMSGL
jgi:very-short-patch-repair endonuclease